VLLRLFDANVLMSITLAASGRIVQAYISMVQSEAICKPDGKPAAIRERHIQKERMQVILVANDGFAHLEIRSGTLVGQMSLLSSGYASVPLVAVGKAVEALERPKCAGSDAPPYTPDGIERFAELMEGVRLSFVETIVNT
jgi:hypothetical protein